MQALVNGFTTVTGHWEKWRWTGLWFLIIRALRSNRLITINLKHLIEPVYLRNSTSDITVFYQVFFQNSYDLNYPSPVEVIIDCGANIGLSSIFYSVNFPKAKIIALEPEENNFNLLVKNCRPYDNIIPVKAGIWNKNIGLEMINKTGQPWEMQVVESDAPNADVEAVSVPYLLEKYNLKSIDILKIDIEGSEKELFETDSEKWLPLTRTLVIELHDHYRKGASQSFFRAVHKYEYTMLKRRENLVFYFDH